MAVWEGSSQALAVEEAADSAVVAAAVDSANRPVDSASRVAAALAVVAEACKKGNNRAALAMLDNLHSEAARALVPSLRLEVAVEALVEQTTV